MPEDEAATSGSSGWLVGDAEYKRDSTEQGGWGSEEEESNAAPDPEEGRVVEEDESLQKGLEEGDTAGGDEPTPYRVGSKWIPAEQAKAWRRITGRSAASNLPSLMMHLIILPRRIPLDRSTEAPTQFVKERRTCTAAVRAIAGTKPSTLIVQQRKRASERAEVKRPLRISGPLDQ